MPFDLSELTFDEDLGQPVTIIRSQGGQFVIGGFVNKTVNISTFGIITVADAERLDQVPEADRVTGSMELITQMQINETSEDRTALSDQIEWRGNKYRVVHVAPWGDFGYWSAVFTRLTGS